MHTLDDLNDLRYVAAITETGSLSGAAKRLSVNHATVFRRITALETRIGVRLFERSGGRYHPTAAGDELARAGALMDSTASQALLKVAGRDLRPSGMVRITTTESVARVLLYPILRLCRQQYPQIILSVEIGNQLFDLSKRDADIAIRPALHPPEHLIGKRISSLGFAVYGAKNYLKKAGKKQLNEHEWIALDEQHSRHPSLRWLENFKPLDQVGMRINDFDGIGQACQDGLGLALLPCFFGDAYSSLERLGTTVPECASELWLLTHPDLRDTLRIKSIFQLLQQELTKISHQLSGASTAAVIT